MLKARQLAESFLCEQFKSYITETWLAEGTKQRCESRLTATGFGSEPSSGQILPSGCPNSCAWASDSERLTLEMKLEPFFIFLLTMFHLVSNGSTNVFIHQPIEKKCCIYPTLLITNFWLKPNSNKKKKAASLLQHYYQKVRVSLHKCAIQTHHWTAVACPLGYSNCHPGNKIKKDECSAHEEHGHETGTGRAQKSEQPNPRLSCLPTCEADRPGVTVLLSTPISSNQKRALSHTIFEYRMSLCFFMHDIWISSGRLHL